ncbi:MAG: delta(1)-pyrroline-2-carboxylate reductase family protein [Castellaniella sp.]
MTDLIVCSPEETARRLPWAALVDAIAQAVRDFDAGVIEAPVRQMVPFPDGGMMISMPCTAADLAVHKLVNVVASNSERGLPTINGLVAAYDGATGCPVLLLDGPTVTARRTAGVSMLGLRLLCPQGPSHAVIMGTGTQAGSHAEALQALYPGLRIDVVGRTPAKAGDFVRARAGTGAALHAAAAVDPAADVIITTTTSASPIYDEAPLPGRLIIGVGAYRPDLAEIGPRTLAGSHLYVDDPAGARHEAGDYIQAGVDWAAVRGLAAMLDGTLPEGASVFKSVGCAAWDLAAARCAVAQGGH